MSSAEPQTEPRRWKQVLADLAAIDPRSLALVRMALGAILLFDVVWRIPDLAAMYADGGVMPFSTVHELFADKWRWSLHMLDGSIEFQAGLFGVLGLLAFCLLVGFQTRLATIGCWFLLASLHTRAPLVNNAGDDLLRVLLFWGMFLPLGRVWSLDAGQVRRRAATDFKPIVSVATAAILLQVCLMYWCTASYKLLSENWLAGGGLQNALEWGGYNKPLGIYLLGHPDVTRWLSFGTIVLEFVGPLLVFIPWGTRGVRLFVVAAFFGLHIGIELTLYVGLFSYISMAAWCLFLPDRFWNFFTARTASNLQQPDTDIPEGIYEDEDEDVEIPTRGRWRRTLRFAGSGLCAALLLFTITYNLLGLAGRRFGTATPAFVQRIGEVTVLNQKWSMFVDPMLVTNWFVGEARLRDGSRVDLLQQGKQVDFDRPERIALMYPNHRWRRFFLGLTYRGTEFTNFRQPTADYLIRRWNDEHVGDRQAMVVDLWCYYEKVTAEGRTGNFQSVIYARRELETANIEDTIDFDPIYKRGTE